MAAAGKRAILSSQNAFEGNFPELWRSQGCPLREDFALRAIGDSPWLRFYEYWLNPGQFEDESGKYCRNQIANAVQEGKVAGMNIVAAGASLGDFENATWVSDLNFSAAAFLVAKTRIAGEGVWARDFFGFDHQGKNAACNRTRWGDCANTWESVQDVFSSDYGVPLDDAVETKFGSFFRQFSKVNITVDCTSHKASFDWAPNFVVAGVHLSRQG